MNIEDHFNRISNEYDAKRRLFIPCFDNFYINSTDFISSSITKPKIVIDLGAGTGLLTSFWYRHFPDSQYLLIDVADDMLKVARKRFASIKNISYLIGDYSNNLPEVKFDVVISALSIHHLETDKKEYLFSNIFNRLPEAGIFVNYDQFCGSTPIINSWYNKYWEDYLYHNGLTEHDLTLWRERQKLDRECPVRQEIEMLERCGFNNVDCIFSEQKFSVILAAK